MDRYEDQALRADFHRGPTRVYLDEVINRQVFMTEGAGCAHNEEYCCKVSLKPSEVPMLGIDSSNPIAL